MATKTMPDLDGFIGSEEFYRHGLVRNFLFTEGIKYLAEEAGAFWLIDVAASYQTEAKVRRQPFQLWSITATADGGCVIECRRDSGEKPLVRQIVEYTDFPLESGETFEWYVCDNGRGFTMLLKSEY